MKSAPIPVQAQEPSIPNKTRFGISSRLTKYAAAAGATLAGATTGQTAIVVWDLSRLSEESRTVTHETGFSWLYINLDAASAAEVIHWNNGQAYDFTLTRTYNANGKPTPYTNTQLTGYGIGQDINVSYAGLTVGDTVNSSTQPSAHSVTTYQVGGGGNINVFSPGSSGYLGVQFKIGEAYHFGWVHLTTNTENVWARVDSVAYNTIAGEGITIGDIAIPEPGAIGLLATGAAGLLAWRARRRAA